MIDEIKAELSNIIGVDTAEVEGAHIARWEGALLTESVVGGAAAWIGRRHSRQNRRPLRRGKVGRRQEEIIEDSQWQITNRGSQTIAAAADHSKEQQVNEAHH